jgi:hypothetical protein
MEVVMRKKRKLAEHVWYKVRLAVIHFSSVAHLCRRAVAGFLSNALTGSGTSIGGR